MSKMVFVLGAGFSAPAGMPVKADLMTDILGTRSEPLQDQVRHTYSALFNITDKKSMENIPLEDVFTMLDRARRYGETIRGLSHRQISDSHSAILKAIAHEFDKKLMGFDPSLYDPFFQELIQRRRGRGNKEAQREDPFAILTLNWDTIPDFSILRNGEPSHTGVDYACYDHALDGVECHLPSIFLKAEGKFNIKLLKLHGSLNWLICSSCGRLFSRTQNGDRPTICFPETENCRFCEEVELENIIITPTLVKDISQTHLKSVWHNALTDLQESGRIVFVGYSFPMADFEFRYILLKALAGRGDVSIRVVLYPPDELCKSDEERWERKRIEYRYTHFFGQRDVEFRYLDVRDFISNPQLIWEW
jgi:hypothetical protein